MKRHFINFKDYFILLSCILISLILIFSNKKSQIEALKELTLDWVGSFQSIFNTFSYYARLEEENKILRKQNTLLALENSRMRDAIVENKRLKTLIGFKNEYQSKLIAAKVIGGNFSGMMNYILLEVGKTDSIEKNMPMVLPNGLVGKIYRVGEKYSIGHILFDQNFRVSAKIQRTGIKGIISWDGGNICELREIPNRSDIRADDLVVTSGYSQIFPEGIYIGKIIYAENTKRSLSMEIRVKPDLNFNIIEEVLIIAGKNREEIN